MNSQIANEVRTIFLPCSVMTLAGLAPLLRLALRGERAEWLDAIAIFGFFGGAAGLVAISFRRALEKSSFTFLSDAASYRNKLWREKMMVLTTR